MIWTRTNKMKINISVLRFGQESTKWKFKVKKVYMWGSNNIWNYLHGCNSKEMDFNGL